MNRRDDVWLEHWVRTRARGKQRYVLTRGVTFGVLLPVLTMVGSRLSGEPEGPMTLLIVALLAFVAWTALSIWEWDSNERRYLALTRPRSSPPSESA